MYAFATKEMPTLSFHMTDKHGKEEQLKISPRNYVFLKTVADEAGCKSKTVFSRCKGRMQKIKYCTASPLTCTKHRVMSLSERAPLELRQFEPVSWYWWGTCDILGHGWVTKRFQILQVRRRQICAMAFSPADYVTETDGQIWILGMPLFYEQLAFGPWRSCVNCVCVQTGFKSMFNQAVFWMHVSCLPD